MTANRDATADGADQAAARVAGRIGGSMAPTRALATLIVVQSVCVVFFLSDAVVDIAEVFRSGFADWHIGIEALAAVTLLISLGVQIVVLLHLLTRQRRLARAVSAAAGGLHDLVEGYFVDWSLTASERDVAWLTLKGLSIAEVAEVRGSAEGTVKAHLHAVYRKSGLQGRTALLGLLIEDLMSGELQEQAEAPSRQSLADTKTRDGTLQD